MSGATIATLIPLLNKLPPSLSTLLDFRSLALFVDLFAAIKPSLLWYQDVPTLGAPSTLSPNLQQFFSAVLGVPSDFFPLLWGVLGGWLWRTCLDHSGHFKLSEEVLEAFRQHGVQRDIGTLYQLNFLTSRLVCNLAAAYNFCPPRHTCIRPECNYTSGREAGAPRVLGRSRSVRAVFFTREHGPVPAKSHSSKCDREYLICPLTGD